jgi:hypothetical protein
MIAVTWDSAHISDGYARGRDMPGIPYPDGRLRYRGGPMAQEPDVRLALLQVELASLESGIRGFDTIAFQVKGWCVTATLAIAGFAVSGRKRLLIVGAVAVVGF